MNELAVSFIIPVYNVEKYIYKCLDSVINQTLKNIEIIIVDDGSPDNCPQICDEYASKDSRIKVIHKENGGVSRARNTGIEAASGKYLYFVDSDDWVEADVLKQLYETAEQTDADLVLTGCIRQYDDGSSKRIDLFSKAFETEDRNFILKLQQAGLWNKLSPYYSEGANCALPAPWSKLIKRDLVINNNLKFDPYVEGIYDDGLFSTHLWEYANKVVYTRTCAYNYRIIGSSLVHAFRNNAITRFEKNCEKIDEFALKYKKDDSYTQAEYCRRIAYMSSFMTSYFFNNANYASNNEKKRVLNETLSRSPWKEAVSNAQYQNLETKHKYTLFCMKHKCFTGLRLYTELKRKLNRH